jgi:hypothetical protein
VLLWVWLWNADESLPNVNYTPATEATGLGALAFQVALGYLIGRWWAVALALVRP